MTISAQPRQHNISTTITTQQSQHTSACTIPLWQSQHNQVNTTSAWQSQHNMSVAISAQPCQHTSVFTIPLWQSFDLYGGRFLLPQKISSNIMCMSAVILVKFCPPAKSVSSRWASINHGSSLIIYSACHESLANEHGQQLLYVIFEKYWKSPALITGKK